MKSISITSIILFLAILLLTVFIGGKEINDKIEETIHNNYQAEIEALKDKINKQTELINSIINVNNKNDSTEQPNEGDTPTDNQPSTDNSDESDNAMNNETDNLASNFEYCEENGGIVILRYIGKQTSVIIPSKINGLYVVKIAENAFADTKVKSVSIPSACREIDWFAFYGCYALSTVYIPSSVESIGYGAFDGCSKKLTIYCESNSFAQKFAQSFGFAYSEYK